MSFSATILFSPPHANEAKCCCCTCKQEPGAPVTAPPPPPPSSPPCTPITITGTGLTVQSSEQLLHVIYQRVEKAVSLAELALSLAKANNEALRRLEEDVAALCQGPVVALKASPLQVSEAPENEEELETEEFGNGVQVVIEELKQLGAASAAVGRPEPLDFLPGVAEQCPAGDAPMPPVYVPPSSPTPQMAHQPPLQSLDEPLSCPEGSPSSTTQEEATNGEPHFCVGFAGLPCRSRNLGQKNARRKRDLVLSKLVHNVHNHIANEKRFDGAESIKSPWNISVVKFLLEKLKHELVSKHHNYTDKELKGACVAYFLTKRREYRNSLNPFKGLKEKEEKKLRSRRYRLFANRSGVARLLGSEEQRLWRGVTEELMSDEEDSAREAGVWVARPPRFRATPLSQLCYRLDANSKHGTKANRVYGPPSERLPSAEVQLLPPQLYNPHFQEEDPKTGTLVHVPTRKDFGPELSSFVEIKVEKDQ
ncbi:uncharacterized protein C14orf93 homolog isoform X1 [Ahaetulla prasina]|uniref:uncharacterized protein C14orf93 homolog isoform X1 n=1 Tax=Ahaetulla prasina TaxID=499056 RepID=UPI0026490BE3|nr:uncharacterized protein C14orf93 homolog isoform X1 [Ahaetulla prasina]XP_058038925.1 uncharacterized protein C14orf93 homolog isoform X1 [Ahaetulla prasina]